MYLNLLIIFGPFPVQQVYSTGRVVPLAFNDPHIVNSLSVAPRLRARGENEQQAAPQQPQSPRHARTVTPRRVGRGRVLFRAEGQ